jgi:Tol biopolymer transport system component/polyisoprenoid-binding protein YceI
VYWDVRPRIHWLRSIAARLRAHPRLAVAGVAGLLFVGAAASYGVLVLSTINAPPPASLRAVSTRPPASVPTDLASNDVACAGSIAPNATFAGAEGAWVLPTDGSAGFVGYRAAEILAFEFVRAPNDAVGRTTDVRGSIDIEGSKLTSAEVKANIESLTSDVDVRDSHLQEFLGLASHPEATFKVTAPVEIGQPREGSVVTINAPGQLQLLDATRDVMFPLQARWNGDSVDVAGQLVIKRSDYGMDIPQLLGFSVSEEITIELSLAFVRPGPDGCSAPSAPASTSTPSLAPSGSPTLPPAVAVREMPAGWGEIAFLGLTSQEGEPVPPGGIFAIHGGSAALTQLTDGQSVGAVDDEPAWSADGRQIAFVRYPAERPPDVWLMRADGTGQRTLTSNAELQSPAWSPDGTWLAAVVAAQQHPALKLIGVSTGEVRGLFDDPGAESSPRWSPDGRSIAFTLLRKGATNEDIFSINPDGSGLRRLTSDPAYDYQPRWSPDGKRIAFIRAGAIWVMDADGRNAKRLTPALRADSPTWSPDGKRLAFVIAGTGLMNAGDERRDLWFVNADGSGLARIRLELALVSHPAWRP